MLRDTTSAATDFPPDLQLARKAFATMAFPNEAHAIAGLEATLP
jgi:hypothetical protein